MTSQPESSSPPPAASESAPHSIELDALEAISLEGFETAIPAGDIGEGGIHHAAPNVLSSDEFYNGVFVPMHAMPSAMLQLQSLAIKPEEEQAARGASDAIYEIAEETPLFRFLIEPSNIWIQRAIAIGAFALPKGKQVQKELLYRKMQKAETKQQKQEVH